MKNKYNKYKSGIKPYHFKQCIWTKRDDSPEYKVWHSAILKRDKYCCRWPNCGEKKKLQCHHIKKWSEFPLLRYSVPNGITLCKKHHSEISGKEEQYERLFLGLLIKTEDRIKTQKILKEAENEEKIHNSTGHEGTDSVDF